MQDAELRAKICAIHAESRGTYGSPRVRAQLRGNAGAAQVLVVQRRHGVHAAPQVAPERGHVGRAGKAAAHPHDGRLQPRGPVRGGAHGTLRSRRARRRSYRDDGANAGGVKSG